MENFIEKELTAKFQNSLNSMSDDEKVNISLDFYEVSLILSLIKSHNTFMESLEQNMYVGFDKTLNVTG